MPLSLPPGIPPQPIFLAFYRELALFQKPIFETLRAKGETDLAALAPYCRSTDRSCGSLRARRISRQRQKLPQSRIAPGRLGRWRRPHPGRRSLRTLLRARAAATVRRVSGVARRCAGRTRKPDLPVLQLLAAWLGVLHGEGDGAKRWLLCSVCSTEWPFRRVLCAGTAEKRIRISSRSTPPRSSTPSAWMRATPADIYLKSVDLTKDGHAVPIVDEIATVALNIWAEEHGYLKLETNLLGM